MVRKLFQKFNQTFGFTPTESKVVFFLVIMFVLGFGMRIFAPGGRNRAQFDYKRLDSIFEARSAATIPPETSMTVRTSEEESGPAVHVKQAPAVVDINTATKEELVSLPGIGEAMAKRIIAFRQEHGKLRSVDDLKKVKGIGAKKFEQIAPYCIVGR